MKRNRISFIHNGEEHILWSWKGDYWNLQSGAETGLYVYNRTVMICSADFSDKPEVYESVKTIDNPDKAELIFDNDYRTIWIIF